MNDHSLIASTIERIRIFSSQMDKDFGGDFIETVKSSEDSNTESSKGN